jgi:hypothetical protein
MTAATCWLMIGSLVGRLAPIWYLRKNALLDDTVKHTFGQTGNGKPVLVRAPVPGMADSRRSRTSIRP